jgi:4-amino-4-deoxy-L-arabinose transferase-like glycosyltransferase
VETIAPAASSTKPQNSAPRVAWAVLILTTLYVGYFTHLDVMGFIGPDEPRYAWIARDMAETRDWVTPRLYGKPWFEKPPLYYWGAALSFKLFGVSEAAARLPSAVSALLATIAITWLAWRVYGGETARWLLLLLPTTVGMIGFSHAAATDMPFSAMLTIAMVAAAVLLGFVPVGPEPPRATPVIAERSPSLTSFSSSISFTSLLFGFFLGLAVLAKGPAALILCGGAIVSWAAFTKRWRDTLRLLHPVAIAAFCVSALPWYILCAIRNPDFLRIFILEHNVKRFLTPEFQHIQPFWFYGEIILLAFLPWTAALLWTLVAGLRRVASRRISAPTGLWLSWAAFCLAFFTISRSKLPGYILPAVPPIGLILSHSATSLASRRYRSFALVSLATAVLFAYAFIEVWQGNDRLLKHAAAFGPLIAMILGILALANLLLGALFFFSRRSAALIAAVFPVLLGFALLDHVSTFTPLSTLSARYVADQIQAQRIPVADLRVSQLRRAALYSLNFYLRTDLQEWDGDASREIYLFTKKDAAPCSKLPKDVTCSELWGWIDGGETFELLHVVPNR